MNVAGDGRDDDVVAQWILDNSEVMKEEGITTLEQLDEVNVKLNDGWVNFDE